jgi:predicted ATPase
MTLRSLGTHRLQGFAEPEHIFQLMHPDLRNDFPALQAGGSTPGILPAEPTPLIGREAEVERIVNVLRQQPLRLLTLTGPGGVGKTRLAIAAARSLQEQFAQGTSFVDLSSLHDPTLVAPKIAQVLGLPDMGRSPVTAGLAEYLRNRELLLVLDDFDGVLPAAQHVAQLLPVCPWLRVLVTSRAILELRFEHEYQVSPLALPQLQPLPPVVELARVPAVALFVERAQAAWPTFQLTEDNAPAVAELSAHLEGLPLAIELAAARIRVLTPEMLLGSLRDRRLVQLTQGPRDAPSRRRTLPDTIAYTYQLLSAQEQALFRLLAVWVPHGDRSNRRTVWFSWERLAPGPKVFRGLLPRRWLVKKSLLHFGEACVYPRAERARERPADQARWRALSPTVPSESAFQESLLLC